ncbi:hypothetical protein [Yinghuangia aomiensis]|uniref:hypothetical protein n=1 Tax=Yinghuangia aomiensis TaxID=676205 RepID=UPI0031E6B72A
MSNRWMQPGPAGEALQVLSIKGGVGEYEVGIADGMGPLLDPTPELGESGCCWRRGGRRQLMAVGCFGS